MGPPPALERGQHWRAEAGLCGMMVRGEQDAPDSGPCGQSSAGAPMFVLALEQKGGKGMNAKQAVTAVALVVLIAAGGCGVRFQGTGDISWDGDYEGVHIRNIKASVSGDRAVVTGLLEYDGRPEYLRNIQLQVALEDKDENPGVVSEWVMLHEDMWLKSGDRIPFEITMRKPPAGTWYIMWLMRAGKSTR